MMHDPLKFFISYNHADRLWAEWIAWQLEAAGRSAMIQAWDFRPGENFVLKMQQAAQEMDCTIAVLSPSYLGARFTPPEWAAAFRQDPCGAKRNLVPVRVRACEPEGLLGPIVYLDLVGLSDPAEARARLLEGLLGERGKPKTEPNFPGSLRGPLYPGEFSGTEEAEQGSVFTLPSGRGSASSPLQAPPPRPNLVVGRENDYREIVTLLRAKKGPVVLTGWPGVGKTTLARLLLEDTELKREFPDGQFWVELRADSSPSECLTKLAVALQVKTAGDARPGVLGLVHSLRNRLKKQRVLLVIDDVWTIDQGEAFRSILEECVGTLLTTRFPSVARNIVLRPAVGVYHLEELRSEDGFRLIATLAPEVAALVPEELVALSEQLEGLPLALQIAARLLAEEHRLGLSVLPLLKELSDNHRILDERAPADRFDPELGSTPTVRLLFERSTDHLDEPNKRRFALLGVWESPAVFDAKMLAALWETHDPLPTLRRFADLGLVEPIGDGWFRMHALLVAHASRLLE